MYRDNQLKKYRLSAAGIICATFLGLNACSDSTDEPRIGTLTMTSYNVGLALNS